MDRGKQMNLKRLGYLLFLIVPLIANGYSAFEAKDHIGEKATVCGRVVSTYYARSSHGEPTFLNLEKPYLNQIFTVVIWGDDSSSMFVLSYCLCVPINLINTIKGFGVEVLDLNLGLSRLTWQSLTIFR